MPEASSRSTRRPVLALLLGGGLLASAFAAPLPATAAVFTVDTEPELRDALTSATSADTIFLTGAGFALTADLPPITAAMTIVGPGSSEFELDAAGFDVFTFAGSASGFSLSGVLLSGGGGQLINVPAGGFSLDDVASEGFRLIAGDVSAASITDSIMIGGFADASAVLDIVAVDSGSIAIANLTIECAGLGTGAFVGATGTATVDVNGLEIRSCGFGALSAGDGLHVLQRGTTTSTLRGIEVSGIATTGIRIDLDDDSTAALGDSSVTTVGGDGLGATVGGGASLTVETLDVTGVSGVGVFAQTIDTGAVQVSDTTVTTSGDDGFRLDLLGGTATIIDSLAIVAGDDGVEVRADGGSATIERVTTAETASSGLRIGDFGEGGMVTVRDSTFSSSDEVGVRVLHTTGEVGPVEISIERSTIQDNAETGIAADLADGGQLTIVNSTITGNGGADTVAPAIVAGAAEGSALVRLLHSTIAGNDGSAAPSVPTVRIANGTLDIEHSVIAENGTETDIGTFGDPENALIEADHSLFGSIAGIPAEWVEDGADNIVGLDPQLGPIADNGGPTLTMLPAATSPLVDAGDGSVARAPVTDQRDLDRIVGARIDIGAVEVAATMPPVNPQNPAAPAPELAESGVQTPAALTLAALCGLLIAAGLLLLRRGALRGH